MKNVLKEDLKKPEDPKLSMKTDLKNFFFLFSSTNSLERAFLPSSTIQAFSVVEASSVWPVVVAISYSVTQKRKKRELSRETGRKSFISSSQNTCNYANWLVLSLRSMESLLAQASSLIVCPSSSFLANQRSQGNLKVWSMTSSLTSM